MHLFDAWPGRKIKDQKKTTYPREQLDLALQIKHLPKLIWVPEALAIADIEDEAQRDFLNKLATGDRETGAFEFVQGTQSDFIHLLREKIAALCQPQTRGGTSTTCLVDTHQKDQRYAFKLADYLSGRGLAVEFNQESRDPARSLSSFEQAVREVQNLIILAGLVEAAWLLGRIKKALKIVAEQFEREDRSRLENIWIYRTPGSSGPLELVKKLPPLIHIDILDNRHSEAVDPDVLPPLLGGSTAGGRP